MEETVVRVTFFYKVLATIPAIGRVALGLIALMIDVIDIRVAVLIENLNLDAISGLDGIVANIDLNVCQVDAALAYRDKLGARSNATIREGRGCVADNVGDWGLENGEWGLAIWVEEERGRKVQ